MMELKGIPVWDPNGVDSVSYSAWPFDVRRYCLHCGLRADAQVFASRDRDVGTTVIHRSCLTMLVIELNQSKELKHRLQSRVQEIIDLEHHRNLIQEKKKAAAIAQLQENITQGLA